MKKLSMLTAFVALAGFLLVGIPSGAVWADGTETLGDPSDLSLANPLTIEPGTGVIAAGVGLATQPGNISVSVPAGATVEQVLLYWEGQDGGFFSGDDNLDTIIVNGHCTGQKILTH